MIAKPTPSTPYAAPLYTPITSSWLTWSQVMFNASNGETPDVEEPVRTGGVSARVGELLVVGGADVEQRERRDLAVLALEHAHLAAHDRVRRRVHRERPDGGLVAAVDADELGLVLERVLQVHAAVDVTTLGQHATDQVPHPERVLVVVGGVEVGVV